MMDCQEYNRSCQKCEYALKEFGRVYGCQLEEDEKAYADEMIELEEMANYMTEDSSQKESKE